MTYCAEKYIDVDVAAELLGIAPQNVRKAITQGRIPAEKAKWGKRFVYQIPLSALPEDLRVKYLTRNEKANISGFDAVAYKERYGEEGLSKLLTRFDAVRLMEAYKKSGEGGICKKRAEVAKKAGISPARLSQLEKAYAEQGLKGMADNIKRSDKGSPRTMCRMAQDYVQSEICRATRPTTASVYERLKKTNAALKEKTCLVCPYNEEAEYRNELLLKGKIGEDEICLEEKTGMKLPKSLSTVNRYVNRIPQNIRDLGRFGKKYWEAKYMPKARREKPDRVNDVWFGDHHVFDLFVKDGEGRAVRPWLTAWTDAKSDCIVGWALSLNPNSDTIVESLTRGMGATKKSEFYGAPNTIYIDNGKDYRSTRLEGRRESEYSVGQLNVNLKDDNALLKLLGIKTVHAIPYRAWSKTIERTFGTIERGWIQGVLPGWCGNDPKRRPESLFDDIRNGNLLTYDEFCSYFINTAMPEYHEKKNESGLSPIEIYRSSEKARGKEKISWAVLATAKRCRETRRVMTSGIRFNNRLYFSPELVNHIGESVTILYSRLDDESISIMQRGDFICEAYIADKLKLVDEDKEKLGKHLAMQKNAARNAKEMLNLPLDRVEVLNGIVLESPDLLAASTITSIVHEKAYRERNKIKRFNDARKGIKTAEQLKSESRIRERLLQKGEEALQAAES